jgi:hypothetical protein
MVGLSANLWGILCLGQPPDAADVLSEPTSSRINPVPRDRAAFEILGANSFAKRPGRAPTVSLTAPTPSRMNPVPQDRADFAIVGANSFAKRPGPALASPLTAPTPSRINPVPQGSRRFRIVGANSFAKRPGPAPDYLAEGTDAFPDKSGPTGIAPISKLWERIYPRRGRDRL